jgi:signal transduction histidine kinase
MSAAKAPPPGGRILVADDRPANRQMLCQYVAQLGHSAAAADNGRAVLELLRAESFDLVLLDVIMPELDGYQVLERLKADPRLSEVPVIVVSGLDEVDSAVRCIERGAEDYLSKPFDPVLLRARIGACLEKKRLRDEERRRARELERTLRQLKAAQDQLVVREKMASLGELTAGIAHEIRNPLNFVTNFAGLAVEHVRELHRLLGRLVPAGSGVGQEVEALLGDLAQSAAKIEEHGRRAGQIVASMLLHARGETGRRRRTDLNALVAEAVSLAYHGFCGRDASVQIELELDLDRTLPPLSVFPEELGRVFLNLAQNACYAAHQRRQTAGPDFVPRLTVRTRDRPAEAEVRVRDNGGGVPAALREKIFEPFFTTKPPGAGTGLGLSLSYDIVVHMHHGSIRVESEEGAFAEFVITLPKDTV